MLSLEMDFGDLYHDWIVNELQMLDEAFRLKCITEEIKRKQLVWFERVNRKKTDIWPNKDCNRDLRRKRKGEDRDVN